MLGLRWRVLELGTAVLDLPDQQKPKSKTVKERAPSEGCEGDGASWGGTTCMDQNLPSPDPGQYTSSRSPDGLLN